MFGSSSKSKSKSKWIQTTSAGQDAARVAGGAGSKVIETGAVDMTGKGNSMTNYLSDHGAVESAFDLARLVYERSTSTVESALDSVKNQANEAVAGVKGAYAESEGKLDYRFVVVGGGLLLGAFLIFKKVK